MSLPLSTRRELHDEFTRRLKKLGLVDAYNGLAYMYEKQQDDPYISAFCTKDEDEGIWFWAEIWYETGGLNCICPYKKPGFPGDLSPGWPSCSIPYSEPDYVREAVEAFAGEQAKRKAKRKHREAEQQVLDKAMHEAGERVRASWDETSTADDPEP